MSDPVVWSPSAEVAARSNIGRFMSRHDIADYEELIRRSTGDVEWFWDAIVKDLPIDFFKPYEQIYDGSGGPAWGRWFVGGRLNVAYNCVDRHALGHRKDKLALIWEGEDGAIRRLTYADLHAETNRLANALKRLGIEPGDRVGVFLPMVPEVVAALLAIAKIGAIAIPIFSGFGAQAVADRLNDCGAKLLITADGFRRKGTVIPMKTVADRAAAGSPTLRGMIVVRRIGVEVAWTEGFDHDWSELIATESSDCPSESLDSETPFMIAYTSGTTGKPKGSVHVHGGFLVKIAQEVAHQVDLRDDDRLFWFTDMGWIMGPWEVVGGLARGGTIFLYEGSPDTPGVDRVWEMVQRHKLTIIGLSPTLIRSLMRHGEGPVAKHDLSSLRILASTGEPWNPDPWLWYFQRVGGGRCPIINFSGGTEVGACLLSALPITPLKPGALIGPALGMDVDVFDHDGQSLREGVGELVCKKPWPAMTRGLWNDPERYLESYWSRYPGVWTHGDWASIDEDGTWYLHGRSDDTLKVSGKRLGPAEVESILVEHPDVAESAAIGVPHELKGEAIWCFAVLKLGREGTEALRLELRDRVARALGKSFAPERIEFVGDLPKTRSAKILRRALRARVLGIDPGDLSSLENPAALEAIPRFSARASTSPG